MLHACPPLSPRRSLARRRYIPVAFIARESPSIMSRAQEAIARRRHEASRLCEELHKKMDPIPN